jgi:hypothetical protein
MVSALRTFEGKYLRSAVASASLVCHLYVLLVASGAEAAFNAVELLFFLFEVVDIGKDRSCQNDNKEK